MQPSMHLVFLCDMNFDKLLLFFENKLQLILFPQCVAMCSRKKIAVWRLISMSQGLGVHWTQKFQNSIFFFKTDMFLLKWSHSHSDKKEHVFLKNNKSHTFIYTFHCGVLLLLTFICTRTIHCWLLNNNRHIHFSSVTFTNKKIYTYLFIIIRLLREKMKTTRNFLKNKNCTKFLRCHWDSGFRKTQQSWFKLHTIRSIRSNTVISSMNGKQC